VIINNVEVAGNQRDPDPWNNTDWASTLVSPAGLSVTKAALPDPAMVGNPLTYTVMVANDGPTDATGVIVTDTLPADVTLGSVTSSQGGCTEASGTVICSLGTLTNTGVITITIVVTPTAAGIITNTVSVTGNEPDPNTLDNTDWVSTLVNPADLSITKEADPSLVQVGQSITYTLVITNTGPSIATGVIMTDTLPTEVTFVSANTDQGDCAEQAGTVTCDLGTISSGARVTVTIVVNVSESNTEGVIINSVEVTGNEHDPDPNNNWATAYTTVEIGEVMRIYLPLVLKSW